MKKITIGTFECTQEDIYKVSETLKSGMLSSGPELNSFEKQVAALHQKQYGIMVNSGQAALEVALECAKQYLKKDKLKVLMPATTYAATLWSILRTNCEAVFCDIDGTYTIDYSIIMDNLDKYKDVDVIMPVDLCGYAAVPPKKIQEEFFIIQDACEALGNPKCNYGDIVCVSFYVSHFITTGCGGMLMLSDLDLAEYARSFIAHGRVFGGDFTKFKDCWVDRFLFDKVGASLRSNNLDASLGLSQLSRLDYMLKKRRANAFAMLDAYEALPSEVQSLFVFPDYNFVMNCAFQFYPIMIATTDIVREDLLQYLFEHGIESRVLLSLTNQPAFKNLYGDIESQYPVAEIVNKSGFIVGCHQGLNKEDMKYIVDKLYSYVTEK